MASPKKRQKSHGFEQCDPPQMASSVTGMAPGPLPVGVTTLEFTDTSRIDPDSGQWHSSLPPTLIDCSAGHPRSLQTEIWYPASAETAALPKNLFSEYLGRGAIPGSIRAAEEEDAFGGIDTCTANAAESRSSIVRLFREFFLILE